MRVEIYNAQTFELIEARNEEPTHDDTCNRCGECLRCCGSQTCYAAERENDPPYAHQWVQEVDVEPEPRAALAYEQP